MLLTGYLFNILTELFSTSIIISALLSITANDPVISVVFLIVAFISSALFLIATGINFVGISYVVIYVGAIAVLFLFVIMMININKATVLNTIKEYVKNLPLAIALGFIYTLFFNSVNGILIHSSPAGKFISTPALSLDLFNKFTLPVFSEMSNKIESFSDNKAISQISFNWEDLVIKGIETNNNIVMYIKDLNFSSHADISLTEFSQITSLGFFLYTNSMILLLILSKILLLSMFSAIIISK